MLKPFKTLLLATSVLIVICVGWYMLLYRPQSSRLHKLRDESEALMLRLQSFRVKDEQLQSLQNRIDSLNSELNAIRNKLVAKDDFPHAVEEIRRRGRAYGLKFVQVIPDYDTLLPLPDDASSEILKLKIHLKMQGRYRNIGNFIGSFPSFPFYLTVDELNLLYHDEIHPDIVIQLDASLFLRKNAAVKART